MADLLAILFLILLNGLFAMSEIALISAKKVKLQKAANKGSKSARIALKLAEQPDKFLSTIQIGITLIGILTGIFSSDLLAHAFGNWLVLKGIGAAYAYPLAQIIIVVVVTYVSIVLGELFPKRIGLSLSDKAATFVAVPMYVLSVVAMPFVWILSKSSALLAALFGIKESDNQVTEEEIKSLVEEGTVSGIVQEVEQDIVERTFMLGDMDISSIMTRRQEVVVVQDNLAYQDLAQIVSATPFEAYPVVDHTDGTILGIMTLKDFAQLSLHQDKHPADIVASPVYFPENMSVYKALEAMKKRNLSRAFVCDEFGGFVGVVTLKDMLEALVGDMDNGEYCVVQRSEYEWYIDGQYPFHDFLLRFNIEDVEVTEYNTIGGLVLDKMEHIPVVGEFVEWRGIRIEVADMDGIRIDKLLLTFPER